MMKTSKEKTAAKTKKSTAAKKPVRSKKTAVKSMPTEEDIREKAREIYYERISRGEHGTAESDWREAEEILRGL